jgi:vacuolar-type H+-ATPase subunit E/Vma4
MEPAQSDAASLLNGIIQDVDRQIRELEEEAASYARTRKENAAKQVEEILRKARESADAQCSALIKNAESKVSIERRKMTLRVRDSIIQETLDAARVVCAESIEKPGYDKVLEGWIVEASAGLSAEAATINASREELPLITDALLRRAEKATAEFTGKSVKLRKIEGDPLPAQGVVLTTEGGKLAYNNQVPTRFLRAQTDIRKRIHSVLFNEGI